MSAHAKMVWPSASGLWSLLWRAVVLTPLAAVYGVLWVMIWPLLILLPFCAVMLLMGYDWLWAGAVAAVWFALVGLKRATWFKPDRRYFPNDQENV
jgi:hypothetical protein